MLLDVLVVERVGLLKSPQEHPHASPRLAKIFWGANLAPFWPRASPNVLGLLKSQNKTVVQLSLPITNLPNETDIVFINFLSGMDLFSDLLKSMNMDGNKLKF